jgi:hypothetical protein
MVTKPIDVYLNDHLAGATFGADLARQLESRIEGSDSQPAIREVATEIKADLETLTALMKRMGTTRNPAKQVTAWIAEKASRVKLSGLTAGDDELGTLLSIETLSLGVEGKASLWMTLRELSGRYPEVLSVDLDALLQRAQRQRQVLETERIAAARRSLTTSAGA